MSAAEKLPLEHQRPRHDRIYDPGGERALDADLRPVPAPSLALAHVLGGLRVLLPVGAVCVGVGRVWRDGDDIGRHPELDGAAAARRRADRGPADQWAELV